MGTQAGPVRADIKGVIKHLFLGLIPSDLLIPYPDLPQGEEREVLDALTDSVREFAKDHLEPSKYGEPGRLPPATLKGLFDLGLMGMTVPEELGGAGFGMSAYCRAIGLVAEYDASAAATLGAHQGIGYKGLLLKGSEALRKRYLPEVASDKVACYALTEPQAGSDVKAITSRAEHAGDGMLRLTGSKLWITNGGFAKYATVFAREKLPDGKDGISAFWVDLDWEGVSRGAEEHKMGLTWSSTVGLFFDHTPVPADHRIGAPGEGFNLAMEVLNGGRLSLAAGCTGGMRRMLREATAFARQRKAFGHELRDFQIIRRKLAQISMDLFAAEAMVAVTCGLADRGCTDYSLEAAAAKTYASERSWLAIMEALQTAGGAGYMREYPYERFLRDSRINLIFEGTNEIQRLHVALAGLKEPGDVLRDMAAHGVTGMLEFVAARVKSYLSAEHFEGLHPELAREKNICETWVRRFHLSCEDLLKKYGKGVIQKQYLLARVADAAINLYAVSCCTARMHGLCMSGLQGEALERALRPGRAVVPRLWRRASVCLDRLDGAGDDRLDALVDDLYRDDA